MTDYEKKIKYFVEQMQYGYSIEISKICKTENTALFITIFKKYIDYTHFLNDITMTIGRHDKDTIDFIDEQYLKSTILKN